MNEYRVLQVALLISFSIHAAIIFNGRVLPFIKPPEIDKKTKVSYIRFKDKPKEDSKSKYLKNENPLKISKNTELTKRIPPPFIGPDNIYKEINSVTPRNIPFNKPALLKPDIITIKRKITLPPVDMAKIDNPSYISYYQIVREKIRRCAYQNYTRSEIGEIYITFVISSDGYLRNVRLVEEKSSANSYLQSIALSSVKGAAPFPNFPKELDYLEISFNVIISFKIE
ncbi:MAG: hypothetical protein COT38_04240 [Candidatus Omnitrophica bacterium CG08_land_8_20_14_0_20_41_16]|uniref:TonB C-terminal domain-containing protein n=1 Tax=Candidatus Sherwoodlollariibacterium unditelluris TaxID=1974757 RepID=A0A2G9YKT1_9BACT|nr:MAG: hypothetical protein COX41_04530 [Candidatus Omnitrophica bacterium CG23_combo_of_CG06-09_8_20_14_all_41_10]PIS33651.1 MAG: hypothetical protein COT38_04240 [Candidatus Omnitrophica bacterium CG08_land_8_20_14_0_20_41_16]